MDYSVLPTNYLQGIDVLMMIKFQASRFSSSTLVYQTLKLFLTYLLNFQPDYNLTLEKSGVLYIYML